MPIWINVLLRTAVLFFVTLFAVRLMGKKLAAGMTPFHFVSYVIVALIASLTVLNVALNFAVAMVAFAAWIFLFIALDYAAMKSKWIHDWVLGKETILIKHGKVMEDNLAKARLTGEELLRSLRSKNAFNLADVEFAVMETTGDINVLLKAEQQPVTPHDLGWKVPPRNAPNTVILDGNIVNEALASQGLTPSWLHTELQGKGIPLNNVFLGQIDSAGDLYLDLYDDKIQVPQPKVKELLYANLEKYRADLSSYALETDNEEAKKMYAKNAEQLQELIGKLKPYLLR